MSAQTVAGQGNVLHPQGKLICEQALIGDHYICHCVCRRVVRQGFSSPGAVDNAAASAPAPDADALPEDAAQGSEPQAIDEAEEREIMGWLDMPVIYAEFLEGIFRLAHQAPWVADGDLAAKLRAMLQDDATGLLPALERKMQPQTEALPQVDAQEPSAA